MLVQSADYPTRRQKVKQSTNFSAGSRRPIVHKRCRECGRQGEWPGICKPCPNCRQEQRG